MVGDEVYDDGLVRVDRDGVTLRRYYFPSGRARHIPYARIRGVTARPMTWWTGKGRLWGTASTQFWLPLDLHRASKSTLIVFEVEGQARLRPAVSPDDPDAVLAMVRSWLGS